MRLYPFALVGLVSGCIGAFYLSADGSTESAQMVAADSGVNTNVAVQDDVPVPIYVTPEPPATNSGVNVAHNSVSRSPERSSFDDRQLAYQQMSDALDDLHLGAFTEYLNGEQADEYTIQAFYTNERWAEFYLQLGYSADEIEQLLNVRDTILSDTSQQDNPYYYSRWSAAPHRLLTSALAYDLSNQARQRSGSAYDDMLAHATEEDTLNYGISEDVVNKFARLYLINALRSLELTRAIGSNAGGSAESSDLWAHLKQNGYFTEVTYQDDAKRAARKLFDLQTTRSQ